MQLCRQSENVMPLHDQIKLHDKVILVTKLAAGGDLVTYLAKRGLDHLPEKRARNLFRQVCKGVYEIHANGLIHCDLKHMNILLSDESKKPRVQITDFGLSSRAAHNCNLVESGKRVGTPVFMAPEVAQDNSPSYTQKVDIWSLGVILYSIISGAFPFDTTKEESGDT